LQERRSRTKWQGSLDWRPGDQGGTADGKTCPVSAEIRSWQPLSQRRLARVATGVQIPLGTPFLFSVSPATRKSLITDELKGCSKFLPFQTIPSGKNVRWNLRFPSPSLLSHRRLSCERLPTATSTSFLVLRGLRRDGAELIFSERLHALQLVPVILWNPITDGAAWWCLGSYARSAFAAYFPWLMRAMRSLDTCAVLRSQTEICWPAFWAALDLGLTAMARFQEARASSRRPSW